MGAIPRFQPERVRKDEGGSIRTFGITEAGLVAAVESVIEEHGVLPGAGRIAANHDAASGFIQDFESVLLGVHLVGPFGIVVHKLLICWFVGRV
jgi:hypothetical protein